MGFFKRKTMENDATKPLETPAVEPVDEVKEDKVEEQVVEPVVADEVAEDRSAFNCAVCGGEGLELNGNVHERCASCGGTGKVN